MAKSRNRKGQKKKSVTRIKKVQERTAYVEKKMNEYYAAVMEEIVALREQSGMTQSDEVLDAEIINPIDEEVSK